MCKSQKIVHVCICTAYFVISKNSHKPQPHHTHVHTPIHTYAYMQIRSSALQLTVSGRWNTRSNGFTYDGPLISLVQLANSPKLGVALPLLVLLIPTPLYLCISIHLCAYVCQYIYIFIHVCVCVSVCLCASMCMSGNTHKRQSILCLSCVCVAGLAQQVSPSRLRLFFSLCVSHPRSLSLSLALALALARSLSLTLSLFSNAPSLLLSFSLARALSLSVSFSHTH